jgi:hypothetical protein
VSPSPISRPCPHHALLITSHNVQPIISPRNLLVVPLFTLDQSQTDNDPLGALLVGLACVRVLRGSLLEEVGLDLLGSGDLRERGAGLACQLGSGLGVGSRSSVSDQGFGAKGCEVEHGKGDRKGFSVISDVRRRFAHDPGFFEYFGTSVLLPLSHWADSQPVRRVRRSDLNLNSVPSWFEMGFGLQTTVG